MLVLMVFFAPGAVQLRDEGEDGYLGAGGVGEEVGRGPEGHHDVERVQLQ